MHTLVRLHSRDLLPIQARSLFVFDICMLGLVCAGIRLYSAIVCYCFNIFLYAFNDCVGYYVLGLCKICGLIALFYVCANRCDDFLPQIDRAQKLDLRLLPRSLQIN